MAEKTYVVHFKPPESSVQRVRAATAEVVDGCLVLHNGEGELVGLFLLEVVKTWSVETIK
jgi:hypothetical protein